MEERYFITKDVRMKKYFERMNKEEWEEEKRRREAENPFAEEDDDGFSHDDDFGDFMEESNSGLEVVEESGLERDHS